MSEYIPYTYLIRWTEHNLWYYGVETKSVKSIAHPSNLWTTYFTSSKNVSALRKRIGEPDVISIRKTFKTSDEAIKWEQKLLKRMKVWENEKSVNQAIQSGQCLNNTEINTKRVKTRKAKNNQWHSAETKNKIREALTGRTLELTSEEREKRTNELTYRNLYDKDFIQKRNAAHRLRMDDPLNKEKQRQTATDNLHNPKTLEKRINILKSQNYREKQQKISAQLWDEKSEAIKEGFNKYFSNPENKEKHRAKTIQRHQKERGWEFIIIDNFKFSTIKECAEYLNRDIKWVRKHIKSGAILTQ